MSENLSIRSEFTLVSTVFNEISRLEQSIADIEGQILLPCEVIITDAGSKDGTWERLQRWADESKLNIKIVQDVGCNVARGRNLAIAASQYDVIVSTDFGCTFHPNWLESIISPFGNTNVNVVGGAYSVDETSITSLASCANYILTNGYRITLNDSFIPSSRSIAYKKAIWERIGGYNEWLTLAADDLMFGKSIRSLGENIVLVNEPYVKWGRHQSKNSYAKESYRYGLGDGEGRVNMRNFISNFIEIGLRYSFFGLIILVLFGFSISLLLLAVSSLGLRSYFYTFRNWISLKSEKYNFRVFTFSLYLVEITRLNYLKGYLKGWLSQKQKSIL